MTKTNEPTPTHVEDELGSPGEEWRPIRDGHYEVSNHGRVRRARAASGTCVGRLLKPRIDGCGYMAVVLYTNARPRQVYIHRLVTMAFIGPCPDSHEVNHKDGDKQNNHIANLEYVTHHDNMRHAVRLGLRPMLLFGEDHPNSKLTDDAVRRIRSLAGTESRSSIAARFGVSNQLVSRVTTRRAWSHVS